MHIKLANACLGLVKMCECVADSCLDRKCKSEHLAVNDAFISVILGIKEITKFSAAGDTLYQAFSALAIKYSHILKNNLMESSSDYRLVELLTLITTVSQCSNPTCPFENSSSIDLKQCSRCSSVTYCSRDCQLAHWPNHKSSCSSSGDKKGKSVNTSKSKK